MSISARAGGAAAAEPKLGHGAAAESKLGPGSARKTVGPTRVSVHNAKSIMTTTNGFVA